MDYPVKRPGIYLQVDAARGFSKAEVYITFGQGKKHNLIVPSENIFYRRDGYLAKIVLKNLLQASKSAKIEMENMQRARVSYEVQREEIVIITPKDLIISTSKKSKPRMAKPQKLLMGEAYLEILVDHREKVSFKGIPIKFDRKGSQTCSIARWRAFFKNENEGLLRVNIQEDLPSGLEKMVKIEIPTFDKGRYKTKVSSRYLHSNKPSFYLQA